jgi:aspartate kinase
VVPRESAGKVLAALESEFATERQRQDIDAIFAQNNVGIVAVVGAGMKGTPGVAARVFGALGERNINVICIAQGSSEYNLSFVLDEKDLDEAVRAVHEECQLGAVAAAKG